MVVTEQFLRDNGHRGKVNTVRQNSLFYQNNGKYRKDYGSIVENKKHVYQCFDW